MKNSPFFYYVIAIFTIALLSSSCNESVTVGSGLLDDEDITLGFKDDFEIKASTKTQGRIPTYFSTNFDNEDFNSGTYLVGELDDPIFGKASSQIHFEIRIGGSINFSGGTMDSMVFVFGYADNGLYGDTLWPHDITIERLAERLDQTDTLYSDQEFEIQSTLLNVPVASLEDFVPKPNDSVTVTSYITEEEVALVPQIRMRMDQTLAQNIFRDTLNNSNDALLRDLVNGFVLKSVPRNGNSMYGLDFNRFSGTSGLEVYYTTRDSIRQIARYLFSGVRHQMFTVNHDGALVGSSLDQDVVDGSPLFVQGMNGAVAEIDLSNIRSLETELINQVELRMFHNTELSDDNMRFFPPAQRLIMTKARNGEFVEDAQFGFDGFDGTTGLDFFFGGELQDTIANNLSGYSFNLSSYAKEVQQGREDGKVRIEVFQKISSPRRTILYGPGHPTLSPQLRITFTEE